jgi:hypothetical protein
MRIVLVFFETDVSCLYQDLFFEKVQLPKVVNFSFSDIFLISNKVSLANSRSFVPIPLIFNVHNTRIYGHLRWPFFSPFGYGLSTRAIQDDKYFEMVIIRKE